MQVVVLGDDGCEEGLEVLVEVLVCDAQVPVEQEEHLLLHQVDLCEREAERLEAADGAVARPVLVFGRRVVEVLGGEDERGEEDAVHGAAHAFCDGGQAALEACQVDEGGHERGDLHVAAVDEGGDELLEGGEWRGV